MCFYRIHVPSTVSYPIIKQVFTASAAMSTADNVYGEEILNGHNSILSKGSQGNNKQ